MRLEFANRNSTAPRLAADRASPFRIFEGVPHVRILFAQPSRRNRMSLLHPALQGATQGTFSGKTSDLPGLCGPYRDRHPRPSPAPAGNRKRPAYPRRPAATAAPHQMPSLPVDQGPGRTPPKKQTAVHCDNFGTSLVAMTPHPANLRPETPRIPCRCQLGTMLALIPLIPPHLSRSNSPRRFQ